jgi:hypothetical protein
LLVFPLARYLWGHLGTFEGRQQVRSDLRETGKHLLEILARAGYTIATDLVVVILLLGSAVLTIVGSIIAAIVALVYGICRLLPEDAQPDWVLQAARTTPQEDHDDPD